MGAESHAQRARERAEAAIRETNRAEAEAWSIGMERYGACPTLPDKPTSEAAT